MATAIRRHASNDFLAILTTLVHFRGRRNPEAMRCTKCGLENRAGRKFCSSCGTVLPASCDNCGFSNEIGENYCAGCGRALGAGRTAQLDEQRIPDPVG